ADPDNRRPVDFDARHTMLSKLKNGSDPTQLLKSWPDGRIKMYVTSRLLQFRRAHPALFSEGEYIPVRVSGTHSNHIIAFARRFHDEWCVVAVPRLCASLTRAGSPPIGESWVDTELELPGESPTSGTDIFTGRNVSVRRVSELFGSLPFAVVSFNC